MKNFYLISCLALIFSSCSHSSVDEWNSSVSGIDPNSKITMKINDIVYQEYIDSNDRLKWNKTINSNGTYDYSIYGYIHQNNFTVSFPKSISFSLGSNIQNGQIININTPGFLFSIMGSGLDTSEYHFVNGTSSGQLKITYYDGITMSGEFNFTNIVKYVENPQIGVNYTNNTIQGTFTSIEKHS